MAYGPRIRAIGRHQRGWRSRARDARPSSWPAKAEEKPRREGVLRGPEYALVGCEDVHLTSAPGPIHSQIGRMPSPLCLRRRDHRPSASVRSASRSLECLLGFADTESQANQRSRLSGDPGGVGCSVTSFRSATLSRCSAASVSSSGVGGGGVQREGCASGLGSVMVVVVSLDSVRRSGSSGDLHCSHQALNSVAAVVEAHFSTQRTTRSVKRSCTTRVSRRGFARSPACRLLSSASSGSGRAESG